MKKADAIRTVIEEIKAQNRSSLNADDFEALKKRYSGKFTSSLAMDFQAEAVKAGIKFPEDLSFEDVLPKRRVTAAEREAGVSPGKQVADPSRKLTKGARGLATQSITLSDEGLSFLLAEIDSGGGTNTTFIDNPTLARKAQTETKKAEAKAAKKAGRVVTSSNPDLQRVFEKLKKFGVAEEFFPNVPEFPTLTELEKPKKLTYNKQIQDAYIQMLYERGWLEDADPDLKDLKTELKNLPKTERNRGSIQGRRFLDTKTAKGIPLAVGVDSNGDIIYDSKRTRPYKLKISAEGKKHLEKVKREGTQTAKIITQLPTIVTTGRSEISPTKSMDDQLRESRRKYFESRAVRGDEPPLANPVTSERTGKRYDNFNQMVAAEGRPPPPGGEIVEPNRGEVSRKAKGTVIVRSDVNTFKQAMATAVSKGGKTNLFKDIVDEARRIDPKVSLNAMQDIKDYLFFTGYLEADASVSGKLGPSRLSDVDVPEYVKPTNKYFSSGLKILDSGGVNEPLVIRKLSADPDVQDVARGAKSMAERVRPQTTTEEVKPSDLTREQRKKRIREALKRGGRGGLKMLLGGVGVGLTIMEEALGSRPLNPYRTSEEQEYDRMMERAKREELIPAESEVRGRTMEEVKSKTPTSFYNQ